jgi:hypothetical protein
MPYQQTTNLEFYDELQTKLGWQSKRLCYTL